MLSSNKIVKRKINENEIINLNLLILVLESKIGRNSNIYPIKTPIQAIGNQNKVFVYAAQVNKSKQIEEKLVMVKISSFFDSKNDVKVGIKEYAQSNAVKTI